MSLLVDDACENGDVGQAINLIEQGYEANESDEEGLTPRIYVAFARQADVCDVLIGSKVDINVQAQDGYDRIIVCSLIEPVQGVQCTVDLRYCRV